MKTPLAELERLARQSLIQHGVSDAAAAACARVLVQADACGLETHGVSRIPMYCDMLVRGRIDPAAVPRLISSSGGTALVDACGGLAYDACDLAISALIDLAELQGVAFAGIRNSSHVGALGLHLEPLAARGLVGLAFSNSPAVMPFWGGSKPALGTNPVAAIFPRRNGAPLLIDMSMTTVARGHILLAAQRNEAIPEGWALDKNGLPTTNAKEALGGTLLPSGGAKGAMLALCFELLCSALTGSALSFEADAFFAPDGNAPRIGQAFLALAPSRLAGEGVYHERVQTLLDHIAQDPEVRLPGARRQELRAQAMTLGVQVRNDLLAKLQQLSIAPPVKGNP
ncbi:Ldh family oxidoreductase [Prosthecobacter sp.]|jgi:(2R)-3-sulfolactate dehydrogenase (NADP+)|uniref:Ldh family oxidoreductase n=1 Tax=Prosthecobacter sp. TaxID=1965333 RepID=UPI0037C960AA